MSNRITIEDLAADSGAASSAAGEAADAAADAASDEDTGKWLLELYEKMQEDGTLQAVMFGPDALPDEAPPENVDASALEDGNDGGVDVDAEVVADALEDVKNTVGDLQLSQLIKLTRENPGLVDDLLEQHLAGDAASSEPTEDLEDVDE